MILPNTAELSSVRLTHVCFSFPMWLADLAARLVGHMLVAMPNTQNA